MSHLRLTLTTALHRGSGYVPSGHMCLLCHCRPNAAPHGIPASLGVTAEESAGGLSPRFLWAGPDEQHPCLERPPCVRASAPPRTLLGESGLTLQLGAAWLGSGTGLGFCGLAPLPRTPRTAHGYCPEPLPALQVLAVRSCELCRISRPQDPCVEFTVPHSIFTALRFCASFHPCP